MQDIESGIRSDICFTYCSSAIEALPMATFICCVKRLFDVFKAFIMPDMGGILFRKTKNDSIRITGFPWLFYVHTIHQFVRECGSREGNMPSEYTNWVLGYYTRNVSTIIIMNRMRIQIECGDF